MKENGSFVLLFKVCRIQLRFRKINNIKARGIKGRWKIEEKLRTEKKYG